MKMGLYGRLSAAMALLTLATLSPASNPTSGSASVTSSAAITWTNTATGTGCGLDESTAIEGINGDTFTLTVNGLPSDWQGKMIRIAIDWTVPANDYDLYVHKTSNLGPVVSSSTGGAPETEEACVIYPSVSGTGIYTIHTTYFANTPLVDQPHGTAIVQSIPTQRAAVYLTGGMTFSANYPTHAAGSFSDGEPSNRTDYMGHAYVAGIQGVPGGCDLWYFDLNPSSPTFDPNMRNPQYRGQPDAFLKQTPSTTVGADGGGDVDLAVGFGNFGPNGVPTLCLVSLALANISCGASYDLGNSFTYNNAGNVTGGVAVDDRQWIEFYGSSVAYLFYRTFQPAVSMVQRSTNAGLTWGPARTAGLIGQACGITVDQNDGTVYILGTNGQVGIGIPDPLTGEPLTYNTVQAVSDPNGVAHIFNSIKVGPDHTVYIAYSNESAIYLASSTDHGNTWSMPVRVSNGPSTRTSVFPYINVGPKPGCVGIVWYGTTDTANDDNADWNVFMAASLNANDAVPTFRQVQVSDHVIHSGNISEGGTLGNANRNLLDYFQVSFDPQGQAVIAYTDDHNDANGFVYATHQTSGLTINGNKTLVQAEGSQLPARHGLSTDGSQVVDDASDVSTAIITRLPTNDALDILSIRYSSAKSITGAITLTCAMKVSDLSSIQPTEFWRMVFAVNCPNSTLNSTGMYSNADADRGDGFYVKAINDDQGNKSFVWGTAARQSDGSVLYTDQGPADSGSFDPTSNTITVSVSASKLATFIVHGPAIASGSILAGLRGSSGQTIDGLADARADYANGGTQYTVP